MVSEAEKYKDEDEKEAQRIAAKNQLESYAYNIKNTVSEKAFEEKVDAADRETITKAADETISWLDENQTASKDEFDDQQKALEQVVNPIMTKFYQAGGAPAGGAPGAGAAPGGFPGAPSNDETSGPTVEEVD
ncbi:unnamed protein product [Ambrosiozyma monospora]|uniref:Unnamed protein product n=1 Tax=Ambrosiozyma monospora TaxID=43982 RepID=A0ACB5TXR1_AMBMO|nr:unnamed protein product [Ambrosiozyma monospora]